LNDSWLLADLYQAPLRRPPREAEKAYWLAQLWNANSLLPLILGAEKPLVHWYATTSKKV
jgi:hypothetical protein